MAKNIIGFIPKKYRQPLYYREVFCCANAIYIADNNTVFIVEARPHHSVAEKWGARIDHYDILKQGEKCRTPLRCNLKTMKETMSIIEKLLSKNQKLKA